MNKQLVPILMGIWGLIIILTAVSGSGALLWAIVQHEGKIGKTGGALLLWAGGNAAVWAIAGGLYTSYREHLADG